MCGIAGFLSKNQDNKDQYIQDLIASIRHRGPDEQSYYDDAGVCLINDRLSIIDVAQGQQPFYSEDKQIVVVQNGEIYNFLELQGSLEELGYQFSTKSDTEVILKAYEHYGSDCFEQLNGMFAIAILDLKQNALILGRDRLGVKPLYVYQKDDEMHFSSEIKSFLKLSSFDATINKQSIHNYLKYNYVPVPQTIYSNVSHVEPGYYYTFDLDSNSYEKTQYWSIENAKELTEVSEENLLDQLDEILQDAVKIRLRSDVNIGAFLSGGLDSSLVCAIAKKVFNVSLDTFSIGFKEKEFDESHYAKQVAEYLGLPNKLHILESDISDLWNTTTWYNDQPHGDPSFIPTFILSKFASETFKLVLTGDGADESFAGYSKYFGASILSPEDYFDSISVIKDDSEFDRLYQSAFRSQVDYDAPFSLFQATRSELSTQDIVNQMLYFDTRQLLPGNNLIKPDKMAMANSLEIRSPFLDYRVFEFMFKLPSDFKLREKETKYLLKKLATRYLPESIVYRKKQMFSVPIGEWFKSRLKDYVTQIVRSDSLKSRGVFDMAYLDDLLSSHLEETRDCTRELRAIVNLELWFRQFVDPLHT